MSRTPVSLGVILPLLFALLVTACGPSERDASWRGAAPKAAGDPAAEAGYLKPPTLVAAERGPGGAINLTGLAEPGALVRLGSPTGEAFGATAGADGQWAARLEPSAEVRLFGLSMSKAKRQVQSQGYLAILPDGRAVQLRAGASAFVYGAASDAPRLLTVDYDGDGAASLAGAARADSGRLSLRIDRTARGGGKVDSQGRFHMTVDRPLNAGALSFELTGETGEQTRVVQISAAPDLTPPFRASRIADGWRIDWPPPGGGVQSTLILDPVP